MSSDKGQGSAAKGQGTIKAPLGRDVLASFVVFLVALPLCMGIAIASGVPPALGLTTGIIGGLVVGFIAGQPLQVSGPAAGLVVLVWELVQNHGLQALGLAVLIAGVLQLLAGFLGMGRWFRAVAPAVIQGMLSGIGVLIFASQFHVMVDDTPRESGLKNILSIPEAIYKGIFPLDGSVHHMAAAIGIVTIGSTLVWNRFGAVARRIPGPLVGAVLATTASVLLALPIARVEVPENLANSLNWVSPNSPALANLGFWASTLGLALIASAETLLCASAVDRMHDGKRTDYNRELRAQGVGNILCGVVGALPMTGVIVRSSANIEAGAKTKWSAILHGLWILMLVVVFPAVLALVPRACLAGILVYTGWKLLGLQAVRRLAAKGRGELLIWGITVVMIVATDLLIGVASGVLVAMIRLGMTFARLDVQVHKDGKRYDLELAGAATFMSIPKLAEALEALPDDADIHLHIDHLTYVDHACMELVEDWHKRHSGKISLELDSFEERSHAKYVRNPKASAFPTANPRPKESSP